MVGACVNSVGFVPGGYCCRRGMHHGSGIRFYGADKPVQLPSCAVRIPPDRWTCIGTGSLVAGLRPSTTTLVRKGIIVASPRPHTGGAGNGSADAHRPRTRGAVRGYSTEIRLTVGFSTVVRVTVIREGGD